MKFSTDGSDSDIMNPSEDIIKVALSWLDRGFRPCVIYPRDYPKPGEDKEGNKITLPASGKEPFGARWGVKPITPETIKRDIYQFTRSGAIPGLGLCLGPGRAPGRRGLMDIEGDGPEAEESRNKLFGGEVIDTIGHSSTRGGHQFFSYDWERLQSTLDKLSRYQTKAKPGVYHLPQLPGLELRVGGFNDQNQLKQLQTVIPPTPGTDGMARVSNGIDTLADVPESFYMFLEQTAEVIQEVDPEPETPRSNGRHVKEKHEKKKPEDKKNEDKKPEEKKSEDKKPEEDQDDNTSKKKRGRPKGSGVGNSIEDWLRRQFNEKLNKIADAVQGERHPLVMSQIKWLAGYLHYQCGYTHAELELAGIEAANLAAPERAGDNPRCVKEAIRYGMTLPLTLPDRLERKYIQFKIAVESILPKPSTNGDGVHGPREPGDDDPDVDINGVKPGRYELTDVGNSFRLIDLHGFDIRYVGLHKSWYVWNGDRWTKDQTGHVHHLRNTIIPMIRQEAVFLGPDKGQDALKWAHESQSVGHFDAIEKIARNNPAVAATPEQFDKDPWLLNCPNGTLDLRSGRLQPHIRDNLILKTTSVNYDPGASCPLWDTFLLRIFNNDITLIEYVQSLVGYSCVGVTEHNILVFLSGEGNNGKSTFLETVADTLGEYARTCDPDLLVENRFASDQKYYLADLFGMRFVYTSEIKDGSKLAEGMVKRITGGDTIKARHPYGHPFDFRPTHTVWLAANQAPDIRGRDTGIWRRIKRIPFDIRIPDNEIDTKLKEKLMPERPGILRWIVDGVARWCRSGLPEPMAVVEAIEEYKEDTDVYGTYFKEFCSHGSKLECTFAEIYNDFKMWAYCNNIEKISENKFSRIMTSRGYKRHREEDVRLFRGIRPIGGLKVGGNKHIEGSQGPRPYHPPED
jgi:putative DNA primase/helicase